MCRSRSPRGQGWPAYIAWRSPGSSHGEGAVVNASDEPTFPGDSGRTWPILLRHFPLARLSDDFSDDDYLGASYRMVVSNAFFDEILLPMLDDRPDDIDGLTSCGQVIEEWLALEDQDVADIVATDALELVYTNGRMPQLFPYLGPMARDLCQEGYGYPPTDSSHP
jgi:hypothetical protein